MELLKRHFEPASEITSMGTGSFGSSLVGCFGVEGCVCGVKTAWK